MPEGLLGLVIAMGAFIGTHFAMSHPLRARMVRALGPVPFRAVYTVISIATLSAVAITFSRVPAAPALWNGYAAFPWVVASGLTLASTALFLASLFGNPALPGARVAGLSAVLPKGVYRVTRHPMMWSFALWALAHFLVAPTPRSFVLTGGIAFLALWGARMQDRKKAALHGQDWRSWVKRTTYWPDLSNLGKLGVMWFVALLPWLAITAAHMPLGRIPAGLWKPIYEMRHPGGARR